MTTKWKESKVTYEMRGIFPSYVSESDLEPIMYKEHEVSGTVGKEFALHIVLHMALHIVLYIKVYPLWRAVVRY